MLTHSLLGEINRGHSLPKLMYMTIKFKLPAASRASQAGLPHSPAPDVCVCVCVCVRAHGQVGGLFLCQRLIESNFTTTTPL